MENYGLQTCIFLCSHSFFFVSFSSFSFVNYELKIGFKAQFLKLEVFDISSARHKSFFDQSTIKRLGNLKLLSYYEVKPLLLGLILNSKAYFGTLFICLEIIHTNKSSFYVSLY